MPTLRLIFFMDDREPMVFSGFFFPFLSFPFFFATNFARTINLEREKEEEEEERIVKRERKRRRDCLISLCKM